MLSICREGGRQVFLFPSSFSGFALAASQTFSLGFDETSVFSIGIIFNCRRGLSPRSALIDNKPPSAEPAQVKMAALGIGPEQVWIVPSFEPPHFPPAKLFMPGLPLRLAQLDRRARTTWDGTGLVLPRFDGPVLSR
jgi:hypothetical protein